MDLERSDVEQGLLPFFSDKGKTWFVCNAKRTLFGDFTMKIVGKLNANNKSSLQEGCWVCSYCGYDPAQNQSANNTRLIVLPASAFDGKQRFLDALRNACRDSTVNLGGSVTSSILLDYASYLKECFWSLRQENNSTDFLMASHMGYQGEEYWIISEDVHVYKNRIISREDHKFLVKDADLRDFTLVIDERLFKYRCLKETLKRYFDFSLGFAQNTISFSLATAFVVARIMRNCTAPEDVWTEGSIGLLYSQERCVGKSLSLQILALAEGIPCRSHRLFLSGGNQNMCGTSTKKLFESVANTTFVVMVDDPTISAQFGEFLLQSQGGLLQGSAQQGLHYARGSFLITSNTKEVSRIEGRVIRMNYRGPNEEDKFDDNKLLKGLLPLVQEFKGLLLAWSMRFISLWTAFYDEFLTITASILARVFAHEQQRWCKGVACVIFAFTLLRISTGEAGVAKDSILHLMADADQRTEEPTFAANLELLVMQRIKEEPLKTLTWLNPCVTVCTQGGKYIKAIGIKSRVLEQTHHFTHHEMLEMLKQIVDAPGLKTTSMWFAKDESTNYQDLKKRNEKTEQVRGRKFPLQLFTDEVLAAIVQACGLPEDEIKAEPATTVNSSDNKCENTEVQLTESEESRLNKIETSIRKKIEEMEARWLEETGESREPVAVQELPGEERIVKLLEDLSPSSKQRYTSYTPRRKKAFHHGLQCAQGINIEPGNRTCTPLSNGGSSTCAKRQLFENVEGAVGVLPKNLIPHLQGLLL